MFTRRAFFTYFGLALGFIAPAAHGLADTSFQIPVESQALLGIESITGTRVAENLTAQFGECDRHDLYQGKTVRNKCSTDPSENSTVLALNKGVIFFDAKMALDRDGSAYARGHRTPPDQPDTSLRYPLERSRSLDSDRVPFLVIPGGFIIEPVSPHLGDIAVVIYKAKLAYAVVGDSGPPYKIGEGSVRLHEMLGSSVCRTRSPVGDCLQARDVSIARDVLYFIFTGSAKELLPGLTPDNINERIAHLGEQHWKELFPSSEGPT